MKEYFTYIKESSFISARKEVAFFLEPSSFFLRTLTITFNFLIRVTSQGFSSPASNAQFPPGSPLKFNSYVLNMSTRKIYITCI